jgi:soluble lytic murein transglycosylase-like protein
LLAQTLQNLPADTLYYTATPASALEVPLQENIDQKIDRYALQYKVSAEVMRKVIQCESNFDPKALGDHNQSRGLVQIHKPSHPQITDEQAFDPDFAISFLAKHLSEGRGKMWTCWRQLPSQGG